MFSILHTNTRIFTPTHVNAREFGIANVMPRRITIGHSNPLVYNSTRLQIAENLYVNAIVLDRTIFSNQEPIAWQAGVYNSGLSGKGLISWQAVNQSGNPFRQDVQWSDNITRHTSALVNMTGLLAPIDTIFKIRARANEFAAWTESGLLRSYAAGVSCLSVTPDNDIYWPGTPVLCTIQIANSGIQASYIAEWEVVKWSDNSVISSGANASAVVAAYSTAVVNLNGIFSPITPNTYARIRARIQGAATWTYASMPLLNFIPAPPENPTPRADW